MAVRDGTVSLPDVARLVVQGPTLTLCRILLLARHTQTRTSQQLNRGHDGMMFV